MNRVLTAALAAFLAVVPLQAQMRGGRSMGGRFAGGPRVGIGNHAVVRGPSVTGRFGGGGVFVRPGFRGRFYPRVRFYPRARVYPYGTFGYYSPYVYSSEYYGGYAGYGLGGYSYYDDAAQQQANAQHEQLNGEVGALTAEVRDLRDENEALREEVQKPKASSHAKEQPKPAPAAAAQKEPEQDPATVIVYKDGHQREVRSFAIVGKTLWVLSEQRAQRVPLADLDLDATEKANAERGIDFPMPTK